MLCQGQRGILEWRFPYPGQYMFHAHQSEFTELGWQGFFEVSLMPAPALRGRVRAGLGLAALVAVWLLLAGASRCSAAPARPGTRRRARPSRSSRSSARCSSRA